MYQTFSCHYNSKKILNHSLQRIYSGCIASSNFPYAAVVVFEFFAQEFEGEEETEHIDVTITRSVATAAPMMLTLTPTEYDDSFGLPIPAFDPRSPNIATRKSKI